MINPVSTAAAPSAVTPPAGSRPPQQADRLREVTQEFESFFLGMILRQSRQAARALNGAKGAPGRDIYESWQDQSLARAIAACGGIGLGEMLYRQLQQKQMGKATE